jgi:hypothetical protein
MAGSAAGPLIFVVDVPTEQHLDTLLTQQPLADWVVRALACVQSLVDVCCVFVYVNESVHVPLVV